MSVIKDHADSPWFHINDIPKPIRRVFYARMQQDPSGNIEPSDWKHTDRVDDKPLKVQVHKQASVKTDDTSSMMTESVKSTARVPKKVRDKQVNLQKKPVKLKKEVIAAIEAHAFPDGNKTFKEVKTFSRKKSAQIYADLDYKHLRHDGPDHSKVQEEYDSIARHETDRVRVHGTSKGAKMVNKKHGGVIQGDVTYRCLPMSSHRCLEVNHRSFWESLFEYSYNDLSIPRSREIREEVFKVLTDHTGSGILEAIVRKEVRCSKIFVDLRIVRKGTYSEKEFPRLFKF